MSGGAVLLRFDHPNTSSSLGSDGSSHPDGRIPIVGARCYLAGRVGRRNQTNVQESVPRDKSGFQAIARFGSSKQQERDRWIRNEKF